MSNYQSTSHSRYAKTTYVVRDGKLVKVSERPALKVGR